MHPHSEMLTTRQTATLLGVSTITLRRYFRQGVLRPLKLPGGAYRVTQEELERFLRNCEPEGAALKQ